MHRCRASAAAESADGAGGLIVIVNVLLGFGDQGLEGQARALIEEDHEMVVADSASDAPALIELLRSVDADVVLLHEDLGPLPVMDLARDISLRFPQVGIVLVVRERTEEVLRNALRSGARDVLSLPLSFDELAPGLRDASSWSRAMRDRMMVGVDGPVESIGGRMVAFAGAKGGVGTSTVALNLALSTARLSRGRRVCLVDLDLQTGDIPILLNLTHRRSIADFVEVSEDLSMRHIDDAVYTHESGLRILLAPPQGERAEDVDEETTRRLLGALKSAFDVVILDLGSVVTMANAVAAEVADEVIVVTLPDVLCLRATNRLLALWERLQVRKDDVKILVNRVSRDSEVQPEMVRKVVDAPLTRVTVPAAFRSLEPAVNSGVPDRSQDEGWTRALAELGKEMGLVSPRSESKRLRLKDQSGQSTAETVALTPVIVIAIVLLWQIVLIGTTYVLAGNASREGARELAVDGEVREAVEEDVPSAWREGMRMKEGADWVEVELRVPALLPGIVASPWRVSSRAGTVVEEG